MKTYQCKQQKQMEYCVMEEEEGKNRQEQARAARRVLSDEEKETVKERTYKKWGCRKCYWNSTEYHHKHYLLNATLSTPILPCFLLFCQQLTQIMPFK